MVVHSRPISSLANDEVDGLVSAWLEKPFAAKLLAMPLVHTVQYGIHTCDLEQTFRPKFAYPSLQKHEDRGSETDVLNHLIMA